MTTRASWLAVVALAALAGGFAVTRCWVCRHERSPFERLQDVSHLSRALDLRPDQIAVIGPLQKRLCDHLAACGARHCACRSDLAAVLTADPFDPARARELRESMCRAYADSEMATLEHIRSIRDTLDERQRTVFDKMIVTAFRSPCGVCTGGRCASDTRSMGAKP